MKSLEFTLTVSKCMSCLHCPQTKLAAAYTSDVRVMTMPTFLTILNKLPSDCQVHFSGFSESFLNPLAAEMMKAASDSGRDVWLYTTLAGFGKEQAFELARCRFRHVRLHVPDHTGFKFNAERWLGSFKLFLATGHPFTAMAMSEVVDPGLAFAIAQQGVKLEFPTMLSRAENLWQIGRVPGKITCSQDKFNQNVVLPDGSVWGCCMDFSLSTPIGNLLTQSYEEILNSGNAWRDSDHSNDMCSRCDWRKEVA